MEKMEKEERNVREADVDNKKRKKSKLPFFNLLKN
jgi:hypothetical protein